MAKIEMDLAAEAQLKDMFNVLHDMVNCADFVKRHKRNLTDFTRSRLLSFENIISFVIGNLGTSLDFEVIHFCSGRKQVSPAAVCKARDKINFTAFQELLRVNAASIPPVHTFKGYRLTAYDGMKGELPRTPELMKKYAVSKNNAYPQFHCVAEYDVLNCCYTNALFMPRAANERAAAEELFDIHSYDGAEIFLLDRGFPSLSLIRKMNQSGKKYVMRVSKSFLREVNTFRESGMTDENISVNYDKRRGATSRVRCEELPYSFNLRCVKIDLGHEECEILITNLEKSEITRKELGELYNLRWRIETSFLNLKYAVRLEDFMGKKENSIKQEFYGSLIKSNIYMRFVGVANEIIYNKKNDKTRI